MGFKWLEKELSRALKIAGNRNRYQYIVVSLLCCIFFLNIFLIVGTSIYYMDPVFTCGDSNQTYDQSYACDKLDQCRVQNDFTIVYKMQLYCSQQYKRSIIQSSLSIGSLLGLFIMNVISDLKGRKFALLVDLSVAVTSSLLIFVGATVQSTFLLILGSIFSGFTGYSLMIICYIMLGDVCQESLRQQASMYLNVFLSAGLSSFFIVYKWFNQWYTVVIIFMFIPLSGVTILSYLMIVQSPNYYLFEQKNKQACVRSLMTIAKMNNKSYSDCQRIKYIVNKVKNKLDQQKPKNTSSAVFAALSKWKYLKVILCMCVVEGGGNLFFYGVEYAINDIGYSFGVNNLLIGITETIGGIVVSQLVVFLPRKKTLAIVYGAIPFLGSLFILDFVRSSHLLCILVILIMKTLSNTGYMMIVMIETQSFPLEIQSIGAGSIEGFSQLGSFAAPFLVAFSINHGLPKITVMGFALGICLIPLIFVPESSSRFFFKQSKKPPVEEIRQAKSEGPKRSVFF